MLSVSYSPKILAADSSSLSTSVGLSNVGLAMLCLCDHVPSGSEMACVWSIGSTERISLWPAKRRQSLQAFPQTWETFFCFRRTQRSSPNPLTTGAGVLRRIINITTVPKKTVRAGIAAVGNLNFWTKFRPTIAFNLILHSEQCWFLSNSVVWPE